nr:uncharacterized mitochondrial protein AtMg00810-like [Tanacetum cinerariifolium]
MYLTASRPDIIFSVCACARFQVTSKTSHIHDVKRIFRYLKGLPKLGLWYPKDSPFDLESYSDSDYAGASLDKKSTTGGFQFLGKSLQQQVLDLEKAKIAQEKEISKLKKRVKKPEKIRKSRPTWLRRLKKVGASKQLESSKEKDSLGDQEDASKQRRNIKDIDQDIEIALVDEAQGRMHDANMFGVDDLKVLKIVLTTDVDDELTLAKTLIGIKAAKPKDPGENSLRSHPHIDHHCCYGCVDSLDGIFCQRCTCESCGNGAHYGYNCPLKVSKIPIYYNDEDDEESSTPLKDIIIFELPSSIAITPSLSTKETKDSLIMGYEHLDTILEKESDEFIKSSVENFVPNLSESEDLSNIGRECDIDSLLDEFVGELIFLKSILPKINEADCDPEEEIRLIEKLLYDNSSPRPPEEINSENSDVVIESFFPSHIPLRIVTLLWRRSICFLLLMDQYPHVLIVTTRTPKGIIFFQKDCCTMILFPSEDTIFNPGISGYHFSSFMPGVSHRSGTFMKFNVYPNHLNESPMEILSSTCSLIDQ